MKSVAICTFARSEYGLLKGVIRESAKRFDTWLIAGADHLSEEKGMTIEEIHADRLVPEERFLLADFRPDVSSGTTLIHSVAEGLRSLADLLGKHRFDMLVVMGDRYELFTVSIASLMNHIPLAHISGGEVSEGAIDDSIRHATTKLAHLHLVANRRCAENVSRMGEEDWRIVVTGEPGIDNIHSSTADEAALAGIPRDKPLLLVTLHPSTLEPGLSVEEQWRPLMEALELSTGYHVIITAPGAEEGSSIIIHGIQQLVLRVSHVSYIPHLGSQRYLAVMRMAAVVVGNSSSGLVEAPSLGIPSVDIGNRQKNRMASPAVIHCGYEREAILDAIRKADSEAHRIFCRESVNPYDPYRDGKNSVRAVQAMETFLQLDRHQQIVKCFDPGVDPGQWNNLLI